MTARQSRPLFRCILHVSPIPGSLVYTSPIFRKLKSYGEVVSFKRVKYLTSPQAYAPSPQQHYRVAYAEQSDLYRALAASPFTVDVDHDLPSPRSLDPYNVFGFQQRKHPEPRTFTCELSREGDEQCLYTASLGSDESDGASPKMRLIKDEKSGPLYKSLLEAGVPLGQLEGLATSVGPVNDDAGSSEQLSSKVTPLPAFPKLMDMYRSATTRFKHWQPDPADAASDAASEPSIPIRKHYIGKPTKPFRP